MGAASTTSLDMPSTDPGASSRPGRPLRNSEPDPSTSGRRPPATAGHFAGLGHDRRATTTSATWTSSSGDWADLSEPDDLDIRNEFVQEYNRVASKVRACGVLSCVACETNFTDLGQHGIRTLAPDSYSPSLVSSASRLRTHEPLLLTVQQTSQSPPQQRRSWFSRAFLRQASTASDASSTKSDKKIRQRRSVSDLALQLMSGSRRDNLKDEDLQSLVRLCGKSKLFLPSEYSPNALVLPTCFRATAQYLVQHGRC